MPLNRPNTRAIDRSGGTILHTSRLNPSITKLEAIPRHLETRKGSPDERGRFDLTAAALRTVDFLKLDAIVALGGDGTLSFPRRLHFSTKNGGIGPNVANVMGVPMFLH